MFEQPCANDEAEVHIHAWVLRSTPSISMCLVLTLACNLYHAVLTWSKSVQFATKNSQLNSHTQLPNVGTPFIHIA